MANVELVRGRSVPVVRPQSSVSEFELIVWPYRLLAPFMVLLAAYVHVKKVLFSFLGMKVYTNSIIVDGLSINSRRVKDGSARWPALNACYRFVQGEGGNVITRHIDHFWMQVRNAQAVRNRLKIVKRELRLAIIEASKSSDGPVRVLSLAAGTAQGVIEVMAALRAEGYPVTAMLIDQDHTALQYARELAAQYGVEDAIQIVKADVIMFDKHSKGFDPHIVEMCGLMDYLRTSLAEKLVRKIRMAIQPKGFFLTCHVHPNSETYFLEHVVDWAMIYRTKAQFQDILVNGNFLSPRLATEPHGIHTVAICQKL
ncbi:MAG: class I SAM-dependent methyltransferase family protein [Candidatus Pacebacteria bacterium]|nr:class I SAM-dependent methyltransferase family protein [Candidatus Paceibacterota bacterium]